MAERSLDGAIVPPHSAEAEQSVLGALLLDNAAFGALAGRLDVRDFYDPAHGAIFGTIARRIPYSALAPESLTTLAHFLISVSTNRAISSGG